MSLLDLRKQDTQSESATKTTVQVDDFIEGADRYAKGLNNVVPIRSKQHLQLVEAAQEPQELKQPIKENKPYRRATFTLSEQCIDSLTHSANQHNYAKSHLIRMMINHFDQLPEQQQQLLIKQYTDSDR